MIENRNTWGDLVKGVSAKFAQVYNQSLDSYSLALDDMVGTPGNKMTSLFKTMTSDQSKEKTVTKSGVGYMTLTPEGTAYASDSRQPGYVTNFQFMKFTNSITVTEEQLDDKDYQQDLDEFADLTVSAKETIDKNAISLFNYAFTAQTSVPSIYSQYGDILPMCSTIHTIRATGGTQSNASATGIVLSDDNLEVARLAMMGQLDDKGKPMRVGSGKLILLVPPALEKTAVIITKGEKRSGTAKLLALYNRIKKWYSCSITKYLQPYENTILSIPCGVN